MRTQHFGQERIHDDVNGDLCGVDLEAVVLADLGRREEDEGVLPFGVMQRLRAPDRRTPRLLICDR